MNSIEEKLVKELLDLLPGAKSPKSKFWKTIFLAALKSNKKILPFGNKKSIANQIFQVKGKKITLLEAVCFEIDVILMEKHYYIDHAKETLWYHLFNFVLISKDY